MEPPQDAQPGDTVTVPGFEGQPTAVLKKDLFDVISAKLRTNQQLEACYDGRPLQTPAGICTVKSIANGSVK